MIRRLIHQFIRPRHYWRRVDFDELAELYVSMMMRSLALSLVAIFVPIYLWELGFSLSAILGFVCWFFAFRIFSSYYGSYLVAKIGPKHTIALSYVFLIVSLFMFVGLKQMAIPLGFIALFFGFASSLFYLGYHVDFSKVKHALNGGKEVGYMNFVERTGKILGPLIGGVIAAVFGAEYIFLIAIALFLLGLLPLFLTAEPVRIERRPDFRVLKKRNLTRDYISFTGIMINSTIIGSLWPLYVALFVIQFENLYIGVGLMASVGSVLGLASALAIGSIIDKRKGRAVLRLSSVLHGVVNVLRAFVPNLAFAVGLNAFGEVTDNGTRLVHVKGMYDKADSVGGRIEYISMMETVSCVVKLFVYLGLLSLSLVVGAREVLMIAMFVAALAILLVNAENFKALDYKPKREASGLI
jgi:MFS transporter, DHA1 family, multidrug resistance protein